MSIIKRKNVPLLLLLLFLLFFPLISGGSGYFLTLAVMVCIYAICAMALNLLVGYGGQISVGNAAFLAVGGYTVAILYNNFNAPIWIALPLAGIVTGIVSIIIGIPSVRLSGPFLSVATLGFGVSVPLIALYWDDLTNGYSGLSVSRPAFLSTDSGFFYVVIVITVIVAWLLVNILKSDMGRTFIAIRDSEIAAQSNGINVAFYKTIMFAISAFFTGIAGGLYSYWVGYVSPNDFTIITSLLILAMIVIGGLASIPGSIIGAVLFTVIPHFTDSFIGITNIIIGIAVVLTILFLPKGLISLTKYPTFKKWLNKVSNRGRKKVNDVEISRSNGSV